MATEIPNTILGGEKKTTAPPPIVPKYADKLISGVEKGVSPSQAIPIPKQPVEPPKPQRIGYEDMFKKLNPYQPPTEQDLEKERKKQRREQIFAAIGDGISALSNLYFTTQYAPNMYSGRNTASQRVKDRWDKLTADRNANMTAYINGLMRARQMDDENANNERAWERQLGLDKAKAERDKVADARAEEEEKRKKELHPYAVREAEGKAKTAEIAAEYAGAYEKSKVQKNQASAIASQERANYYRNGGGSGANKYYGRFREKDYKTQADYERDVLNAAKEYGILPYEEVVTERSGYNGNPTKTRRYNKDLALIAAEVERRDAEEKLKESSPYGIIMPGVGDNITFQYSVPWNNGNTMPGVK